jgi:hypothetical protein
MYVLNDPKIFLFLLMHMSIKNTQNFTLISNPWIPKLKFCEENIFRCC